MQQSRYTERGKIIFKNHCTAVDPYKQKRKKCPQYTHTQNNPKKEAKQIKTHLSRERERNRDRHRKREENKKKEEESQAQKGQEKLQESERRI